MSKYFHNSSFMHPLSHFFDNPHFFFFAIPTSHMSSVTPFTVAVTLSNLARTSLLSDYMCLLCISLLVYPVILLQNHLVSPVSNITFIYSCVLLIASIYFFCTRFSLENLPFFSLTLNYKYNLHTTIVFYFGF